jgi:hypothetical protein
VSRRTFTALAIVSALASVALFIAGVSGGFESTGRGGHGEGGTGYFVGSLLAMVLAGLFTYLALAARARDRGER